MKTKILLGAGLGVCALSWAAKDPVIMTVNGVDVPKSEFEYLYHKNSQQQLSPQPISEYLEMFKNYRLKVADALAEGLDTTASFRQEMAQYRSELATPYLTDSTYLRSLVRAAYDRSKEEVEASHIMRFKSRDENVNARQIQILDSLRAVLAGGGDFAELAEQYSMDRGSNGNGGSMGYIIAGRLPYAFEEAAYTLAPGQISEIVESPVAYHILKGGKHRPARGMVRVSHIMKMVPNTAGPLEEENAKNTIDSIYTVLLKDQNLFERLAIENSDDPGSARQGGLLPWFGAGQMVAEFDSVSFALPVGGMSAPFRTRFGWHIVYKSDEKGIPSYEEMEASELQKLNNPQDERHNMIMRHQTALLEKRHKGTLDHRAIDKIKLKLVVNGLDSTFYADYKSPSERGMIIGSIGKTPLTAGELVDNLFGAIQPNPASAGKIFDRNVELFYNKRLVEAEQDRLEAEVPEYRNLFHEYENGSLLYEVSVKKVWDRASKDEEGLKNYFETHRDDYKWIEPKAKGILVQAKNDSVAEAVARRYAELNSSTVLLTLRKEFKGDITAERILAQKGQNPMVDNLMFGMPEVKPSNSAFEVYFMLDGKVLDNPESVADVRGQVTGDYQEMLEKEWIRELREKYPVSVDEKVLRKIKK